MIVYNNSMIISELSVTSDVFPGYDITATQIHELQIRSDWREDQDRCPQPADRNPHPRHLVRRRPWGLPRERGPSDAVHEEPTASGSSFRRHQSLVRGHRVQMDSTTSRNIPNHCRLAAHVILAARTAPQKRRKVFFGSALTRLESTHCASVGPWSSCQNWTSGRCQDRDGKRDHVQARALRGRPTSKRARRAGALCLTPTLDARKNCKALGAAHTKSACDQAPRILGSDPAARLCGDKFLRQCKINAALGLTLRYLTNVLRLPWLPLSLPTALRPNPHFVFSHLTSLPSLARAGLE